MSISLGLDVGAVSVKVAALGAPEDHPLLAHLAKASSAFFIAQLPRNDGLAERSVMLSAYRRLQGDPLHAASDLLREFGEVVPEEAIAGICFTGSGGRTAARAFDARFENEFRALGRSMHALYPQVRTVFEMGGQTSKYIRLGVTLDSDHLGILDYQCSTECAAGTGSFIDQQASRLLYEIEDVGAAACGASCAARVAGCGPLLGVRQD
jgi:activator of 2-hydroxyglutaryl-CoA dehydratase